ncbi:MAG: flagellar hook-length control protein FliK [Vampirovibrionales bacterium]
MMITVAPASESILKAVSSANSEALVVNAKNNSSTNDFKSALNQAKQESPAKAETPAKKVDTSKDEPTNAVSSTATVEKSPQSPTEESSQATPEETVATATSLDAALAVPYVTVPPVPTLTLEAPVAEATTEEKPDTPLVDVLKKPETTVETPLELTPVEDVDPTVLAKAVEAVKLDSNNLEKASLEPTNKSFTVQDAVKEKVLEASQLLNLDASKVVQDAPVIVSANALEASLKAGDTKTLTKTPLESTTLTESSTLIETPVAQAGKPATQGEGFSQEGEAPAKEELVADLPTTVQGVVPDTAFTKPLEGVVPQAQGVQGIQPLTHQVASGIQSAYDSTNKTMQIQLNPEDLGHMRIQIKQIGEGQVSARLVVERPEAVEQVKTQLQDLQRNLEQQGLKMDKIEIVLAGANSQGSADASKDQNKDSTGQGRFEDGLNKDGAFQHASQEERANIFQDELNALNAQISSPLEGADSQARLEELNALRQSFQSYKQQSVSIPEVPKNQVFSTFNRTGLNVLA